MQGIFHNIDRKSISMTLVIWPQEPEELKRVALRVVFNCSPCPSVCTMLLVIGVSIGPGLTALTRILRYFRSTVHVRANDRIAALVAL